MTSFLTEGALARKLRLLGQETSANQAHVMVISLQRYWQLKEAQRLAPVARYDEELTWANWNPEVPLLLQSRCPDPQEPSPPLPDDSAAADVEGFLERVYALATNV